ncbi:Hypothetical predicted protein [Olea europaea subsp. europaea]|uniref:Uncharacterized protein n=1 Tax=Olea europaea subsp. europaea TaxID=158383 RepID=A0A8S0U617_OLEEU|nr:Hypothetical predicted protein [Olea europaea subsp. europaea]
MSKSQWIPAQQLTIHKEKEGWISTHPPGCKSTVVYELRNATLLDIGGKIDAKNLIKNKVYNAYLVFKLKEGSKGLEQAKALVRFAVDVVQGVDHQATDVSLVGQIPRQLNYGWKEIKLGDFQPDEEDKGLVEMRLFEKETGKPKSGLIVKGIEVRTT